MIETVLAAVLSVWAVGIIALFVLWLVHGDSEGWAIFWLLVGTVVAYFTFEVDVKTLGMFIGAYIPIGLFWSFFRWRRFCNRKVAEFNEYDWGDDSGAKTSAINHLKRDIDPSKNVGRVVQWIFIWPFSLIDNILGDIYDMVVNLVRVHLISLYRRISDNALKRID